MCSRSGIRMRVARSQPGQPRDSTTHEFAAALPGCEHLSRVARVLLQRGFNPFCGGQGLYSRSASLPWTRGPVNHLRASP